MESEHSEGRGVTAAQISNGAVQLISEYTGRGPTKARTTITSDLVTIILGDGLTKAEQRLIEEDDGDLVLDVRRRFQQTMREESIALVEEATNRTVVAFMSDHHLDPDLAAEVFVLEAQPADAQTS